MNTQQEPSTILDYMVENYEVLVDMLRNGVSIEDVQWIAPLKEMAELREQEEYQMEGGYINWVKLNAAICRKYYVSEVSLWRAKKRLEREFFKDE